MEHSIPHGLSLEFLMHWHGLDKRKPFRFQKFIFSVQKSVPPVLLVAIPYQKYPPPWQWLSSVLMPPISLDWTLAASLFSNRSIATRRFKSIPTIQRQRLAFRVFGEIRPLHEKSVLLVWEYVDGPPLEITCDTRAVAERQRQMLRNVDLDAFEAFAREP